MDELPIYDITIDSEYQTGENELGMDAIALTNDPAIIVKGFAYKSEKKALFADEKKYRITAPAMIPMDIYRRDEDGEYEVRFTKETIDEIFKKFMGNLKNQDIFNLEHEGNDIAPAYILEAWLVDDPKMDKAKSFGLDVPSGTLMITAQITDKDYYNEIVENEQFGFSIEAFLGLQPVEQFKQNKMELPNGKFTAEDGTEYNVVEGKLVPVEMSVEEEVEKSTEVATEEVTEVAEPTAEAVAEVALEEEVEEKEEEMAEETETVEEEVEAAVDPELDREAVLAIVQPLIDEIISELATLKEEMAETAEDAPVEDAEVEMSAHSKFSNLVKFLKNG